MNAIPTRDELQAGVEAVSQQAGGLLELAVVEHDELPGLVVAAMEGNAGACQLVRPVTDLLRRIETAPRRTPMLCATCPRSLQPGRFSICVALPASDDRTRALGLAVCTRCARGHVAVTARAVEALRKIWPDGRPVTPTHATGGHA